MKTVLLLQFLLSVFVFSYADSSGVLNRWQGFSMCYFAQLVSYVGYGLKLFNRPLSELRMTFSQQVIVAMYTLAAISKLKAEGIYWFLQYEGLAVQTSKSWLYAYVTTGDVLLRQKAELLFHFIMNHQYITCTALLIAQLLETFSVVSLISRPVALFWGLGLVAMHIGISLGMDILIIAIALPMTLYFVNPPAIILALYQMLRRPSAQVLP